MNISLKRNYLPPQNSILLSKARKLTLPVSKTQTKTGSTVTDPEQKADILNDHFHSVFSEQIPMRLSAVYEYLINLFQNNENDISEVQVKEKGVLKLLQALNIFKAAGRDGIRSRELKELSSELAPILTLLFSGISAPTIPPCHEEACQCEPYVQERREDIPIQQ